MNKLWIISLLIVAGLCFAITPAESWTLGAVGKYNASAAGNVTTEGGNVTALNLTGNVSTERWAGYWGNVTGRLLLTPGTGLFYSWAWSPANGGAVCATTTASSFTWANVQSVAVSAVDTAWGFIGGTDNATLTYTQSSCKVKVAGVSVSGTAGNYTGQGGFQSCAVSDNVAPTTKPRFAFCVNISGTGTLFNGQTGAYELLVPANETPGSFESYYFWLELK